MAELNFGDIKYLEGNTQLTGIPLEAFQQTGNLLTERAITNQKEANELAIQTASLNSIQGRDEKILADELSQIETNMKSEVEREGGWHRANIAVSNARRSVATSEKIKQVLSNKALETQINETIDASDATEEMKQLAKLRNRQRYNDNGGAYDENGLKRNYQSTATVLGTGHDTQAILKEYSDLIKGWKANSQYVTQEIGTLINGYINSDPNIPANVKQRMKGFTEGTIKVTDEREISDFIQRALFANSNFVTAMRNEAELRLWQIEQTGGSPKDAVENIMYKHLANPANANIVLTASPSFAALTEDEKNLALANPKIGNKYLSEGLAVLVDDLKQKEGESQAEYNLKLNTLYANLYTQDKVDNISSIAKREASVEQDFKTTWFDKVIVDKAREKARIAKANESNVQLGITQGTLDAKNILVQQQEELRDVTNQIEALDRQLELIDKSEENLDTIYGLENQKQLLTDTRDNLNRMRNSMYTKLEQSPAELEKTLDYAKDQIISRYRNKYSREKNGFLKDKDLERVENAKSIDELREAVTDLNIQLDRPGNKILGQNVNYGTSSLAPASSGFAQADIDFDELVTNYVLNNTEIQPAAITFNAYTITPQSDTDLSSKLENIENVLINNPGSFEILSLTENNGGKLKINGKVTGQTLSSYKELHNIISATKSGQDKNKIYNQAGLNISPVVAKDENGNSFNAIKVTIPPQGNNNVTQEVILRTQDPYLNTSLNGVVSTMLGSLHDRVINNPNDFEYRQQYEVAMSDWGGTIPVSTYGDNTGGINDNINLRQVLTETVSSPYNSNTEFTVNGGNLKVSTTKKGNLLYTNITAKGSDGNYYQIPELKTEPIITDTRLNSSNHVTTMSAILGELLSPLLAKPRTDLETSTGNTIIDNAVLIRQILKEK